MLYVREALSGDIEGREIMEIEELIKINQLNPIDRFDLIVRQDVKELCLDILVSLFAIDKVIRDNTNIDYYYYIQDDRSVFFLLKKSLYENLEYELFVEALFYLDYAKLIYRFTCAKKFDVEDELINQLRINSWGREFILQHNLLKKREQTYGILYRFFNDYYMKQEELYKKLLGFLLHPMSSDNVHEIKRINEKMNIKLLS